MFKILRLYGHGSYGGYGGAVNLTYNANGAAVPSDNSAQNVSTSKYGTTPGGVSYLVNSPDSYVNAMNQEALWNREDKLRAEAEHREDYEMDRLIAAAKRNGINPVLLMDAISGNTGSAASYSTSAAKTSNYETNSKTDQANSATIMAALIAALGLVLAHL